jgi:hypothetical protein
VVDQVELDAELRQEDHDEEWRVDARKKETGKQRDELRVDDRNERNVRLLDAGKYWEDRRRHPNMPKENRVLYGHMGKACVKTRLEVVHRDERNVEN